MEGITQFDMFTVFIYVNAVVQIGISKSTPALRVELPYHLTTMKCMHKKMTLKESRLPTEFLIVCYLYSYIGFIMVLSYQVP